ncbi:hypothetical protein BSL78_08807 [Apostichopus japonicus]|uniref:Uncharacterized protein n=1 Tax=Stichopus japonicus TaxID=307972 RepID=A0A2G8L1Y1_STIJA|nr:hypothetical protein BSL78_08807 [Apostichopus japonicus]
MKLLLVIAVCVLFACNVYGATYYYELPDGVECEQSSWVDVDRCQECYCSGGEQYCHDIYPNELADFPNSWKYERVLKDCRWKFVRKPRWQIQCERIPQN